MCVKPMGHLSRKGDAVDEVVGTGGRCGRDIILQVLRKSFGQAVKARKVILEFGFIAVVPEAALIGDSKIGQVSVADVAQELAECAVGFGVGIVSFDGDDEDGLAAGREKVPERMKAALTVEKKGDRLQPGQGLENDSDKSCIGIIDCNRLPILARGVGRKLAHENGVPVWIRLAACIVDCCHSVTSFNSEDFPMAVLNEFKFDQPNCSSLLL
ncbi:MAG: hypothetical protein WC340_02635 [Kiritimatiellia bacterium]